MVETVMGGPIRKSERPTIMSGKVVTLALEFRQEDGIFGPANEATGPFEVSISRDAVMVHRAECQTAEQVDQLIYALTLAKVELDRLRGYGNGY